MQISKLPDYVAVINRDTFHQQCRVDERQQLVQGKVLGVAKYTFQPGDLVAFLGCQDLRCCLPFRETLRHQVFDGGQTSLPHRSVRKKHRFSKG